MRTAPALLIVLAATLALTGCQPDDSPLVVDPSPSVTPIFESDEEALAAAEAAYGEYLAVSDLVSASGGADVGRLAELVTPTYFASLAAEYESFANTGNKTQGSSSFDGLELQQHIESENGADIVVYACLDVSGVSVLDSSGADVTPPDRRLRLPLEVALTQADSGSSLLISSSVLWDGSDFCG